MSDESQTSAPVAAPPSVGAQLVIARERLNLSAADVARQLRLQLRQVEALEADRFQDLPGITFVRGFLRNYARVVQLDPAAVLATFEAARPRAQAAQIAPASEQIAFNQRPVPNWVWLAAGLLVTIIAIPLLVYALLTGEAPPASPPTAPAVAAAPSRPAPAAAVVQGGEVAVPEPLALPPAQTAAQSQAVPAPGKGLARLRLVFIGESWAEVRDRSGAKVFSQLSAAGSEYEVQGEPPLDVVIGSAAQVRITYNGEPVDLAPHTKINVARFTLE